MMQLTATNGLQRANTAAARRCNRTSTSTARSPLPAPQPGLGSSKPLLAPPARAYLENERRGAGGGAPAGAAPANQLEALKAMSVVVADTGEPALVKAYKPGGRAL
jgi:hypothetical protein